jgi:octaprenyl-diphosphate synthase
MTSPPDTSALTAAVALTGDRIKAAMQADLEQALAGNDPLLIEVLQYALLGGGKRIRPMLAIISSRLCGRDDDRLSLLACAFEYLHVATLIHDDVIDHADRRRGQPSVVARYGTTAAILAGDWLHARSMHLIGSLAGQEGLDIFCGATTAMVDGEFLQLRHVANTEVNEEQYMAVILRKTARLISSSCEIGALFGGGSTERKKALAEYGRKVGIAFQIIDDLLDYLGDSKVTGKEVGNDFVEGKLTLPLIHALERADSDARNSLISCIRGDRSHAHACATAKKLMQELDSFSFARNRAEEEIRGALDALSIFDRTTHGDDLAALEALAGYVLARTN